LANKKKLLVAWTGDHDHSWQAERGETMYDRFIRELNTHVLHGVSYLSLYVGDQLYRISGAHRHNGFSIYNKAHAALRLYRDDAFGSDICLTAHTHGKAYLTQTVKRFGGEVDKVHFISIGAYKRSDRFLRKKGYHRLGDDEIGGQSLILYPDRKKVEVCWSITSGLERFVFLRKQFENRFPAVK